MATLLQQGTQVRRTLTSEMDDTVVPSLANYVTDTVSILDDLNNLRSQVHNLLKVQTGNWYDDLVAPTFLDPGTKRGANELNEALHVTERSRRLVRRRRLVDVAVGIGDNKVILALGELPSQTKAAVGAVTTRGTVVAEHAGTFGDHAVDLVTGYHVLAPKNLLEVTDKAGDPLLSDDRRIWGLLQSENGTDGHTVTGTTLML